MIRAVALSVLLCSSAMADDTGVATYQWDSSPLNFDNSSSNFENSRSNFENSPDSFSNSPFNWGSTNGVYNTQGERQGYSTESPSGVQNYYNNLGEREAYQPKDDQ